MSRKSYPSDVSREVFETIREKLEEARARTRPRQNDLYDVFCAILYRLTTGCPWRKLPEDFPRWRSVHEYQQQWSMEPEKVHGNYPLLDYVLLELGKHDELDALAAERGHYGFGR